MYPAVNEGFFAIIPRFTTKIMQILKKSADLLHFPFRLL